MPNLIKLYISLIKIHINISSKRDLKVTKTKPVLRILKLSYQYLPLALLTPALEA